MKIVRYEIGKKIEYGRMDSDTVRELSGNPFGKIETTSNKYKLGDLRLLSPCVPSKIAALGLNYRSHAEEENYPVPDEPILFLKPATAVIGPEDNIIYPDIAKRVDFEGELGVVIGKTAHHVPKEKAMDYILGYTCFNDVTARDLQRKDGQWTRSKSFDTFAPIGPWIETELDPSNLNLETYLNGERKQKTNTNDLIFSVPELVNFISHIMTIFPGDIIATGTPNGIGPMQPGDTVEIKIEKIGTLRNHVSR